MENVRDYLSEVFGLSVGVQNKILLSLIVVFLLWFTRFVVLRIVWNRTKSVKARYQWKRTLSLVLPIIGLVLLGSVWVRGAGEIGAFLGLIAAGIAIALKDLLTNLAGWIFILFRKPFVVGDRVQIGQHSGDIIDIRLFQFTMLEIGNWVDADQSTGRIIHLPNGKVFQQPQANYSTGFEFIWNEIAVNITFESDWKKAREILKETINKHAVNVSDVAEKEIFEASKNFMIYYRHLTPIVYTKVKEFGVQLTMRYLCNPRRRRGSENDIWEEVLERFDTEGNIRFAYPTTRFYQANEETK